MTEGSAPTATARVALVTKPSAYPGAPDNQTREQLDALFNHMFPNSEDPEIPGKSAVFAVIARNPKLALLLVKVSDYIVGEMYFTYERQDLRQLLIQALCYHYKCDFNFMSHIPSAQRVGLSVEQQALIPFYEKTNVFNEEQKLVIEYTNAVVVGNVPDDLFTRVVKHFGEEIAIEFTTAVAWWSFWAMIANATRPQFDFGYANGDA